mgnify:CR=1 FL=1
MDHLYNHFFVGKFGQTLFYSFHRSLYICFDNERKFLQIACLNLIKEIIQR